MKFYVDAHIPRGSGDAEYRIMFQGVPGLIVAIVDPMMQVSDPGQVADRICELMNAAPEGSII